MHTQLDLIEKLSEPEHHKSCDDMYEALQEIHKEVTELNEMDPCIISLDEYISLKNDRKTLNALQDAGVDNWEGYSVAIEIMNEES